MWKLPSLSTAPFLWGSEAMACLIGDARELGCLIDLNEWWQCTCHAGCLQGVYQVGALGAGMIQG